MTGIEQGKREEFFQISCWIRMDAAVNQRQGD
jgi:hypothetical protein